MLQISSRPGGSESEHHAHELNARIQGFSCAQIKYANSPTIAKARNAVEHATMHSEFGKQFARAKTNQQIQHAPASTIDSGASPICSKRPIMSIGTTAAANPTLSRNGHTGPLSKSGNMPDTPHNPPANTQAGNGTSYHYGGPCSICDTQCLAGRDVSF